MYTPAGPWATATPVVDAFGNEFIGLGNRVKKPPVVIPEVTTVESMQCVDGAFEIKLTDGTGLCFQPDTSFAGGGNASNASVTSATALGAIAGTETCSNIVIPKCGAVVKLTHEYGTDVDGADAGTGFIWTYPEFQIDGGAWADMAIGGGADETVTTGVEAGEHSFTDYQMFNLSAGPHEVCFRIRLDNNQLPAGAEISINRQSTLVDWNVMKCCPAA